MVHYYMGASAQFVEQKYARFLQKKSWFPLSFFAEILSHSVRSGA
jgi:hypothetical protein